jgi:hypothetical protein
VSRAFQSVSKRNGSHCTIDGGIELILVHASVFVKPEERQWRLKKKGCRRCFGVFLRKSSESDHRNFDIAVAQNESNLNQNLETLYQKLLDLEDYLAAAE